MRASLARLSRAAEAIGETNDCTVKALAVVTGASYDAAHEALRVAGRVYCEGASYEAQRAALRTLNHRVLRVWTPKRLLLELGSKRRQLLTTLDLAGADLPPLLVHMNGHVAAFQDGIVHDWTNDRKAPILEAWEVVQNGAPLRPAPDVVYLP